MEEGKYYSYNGKLYKANLTMPACVWPPDTAGLWQSDGGDGDGVEWRREVNDDGRL